MMNGANTYFLFKKAPPPKKVSAGVYTKYTKAFLGSNRPPFSFLPIS